MRTRASIFAMLLVLSWTLVSAAYDQRTHREIGQRAAEPDVSSLDPVLKAELEMLKGVRETFPGISESGLRTVRELIGDGAFSEDVPDPRVLNHFHNPLATPWAGAGLRILGIPQGQSSVLWQQNPGQDSVAGGGNWSWQNARRHFLNALTGQARSDRESAFASVFEALGHLSHLVQDASVPAHVRNDPHPSFTLFGFKIGNPDWYEDWMEENRVGRVGALLNGPIDRPTGPLRPPDSIFTPTGDDEAPVPIARLIDADKFRADLGNVQVTTDDPAIGISEYTSGNFLSRDTLFKDFVFPRQPGLDAAFVVPEGTKFRRYFSKVTDGERIQFFVTEGALHREMRTALGAPPPVGGWFLDDRVHQEYAGKLLPRAVGYSAALLDYFFRGRLDLDLLEDPTDPVLFNLVGTNASSDTLVDGTLTLYADDPSGMRSQVQAFGAVTLRNVAPGGALEFAPFQPPADAERFVVVYEGTLGQEVKAPARNFPGGVIGKVLGGVRVEEIFADGEEWRLRTPKGVFRFDPPLEVAQYEQVKWGDEANLLVARTTFGPGQANRVDAFQVSRMPSSIDLATVDTPDGPRVPVTRTRSAVLPAEGIPTGTTVNFHQTWSYRQQMVRVQEITIAQSCQDNQPVGPVSITATAPQLETLTTATADFPLTFPIVLDAAHYFSDFNFPPNYAWLLLDVGIDASGRLVGLVNVFWMFPDVPTVPIVHYVIDRTTGAPVEYQRSFLFASYPPGSDPTVWALVDLSEGQVITSTAEPTITISYHKSSEGSPLVWPNGEVGVAAHTTLVACGMTDLGWGIRRVDSRSLPPGTVPVVRLRVDERVGDEGVSLDGLFREDLKSALASAGFVGSQMSAIERTEPVIYVCLRSNPVGDCQAVEVASQFSGVSRDPAFLEDARRPSATPAGERIVLLAKDYTAPTLPLTAIAVMEANTPRTQVRYQPRVDFAALRHVTTTLALVTEENFPTGVSTTLAFLDGSRAPIAFEGADLGDSFRLLDPLFLYNVQDLKFYRLSPPLQRTTLPATLADFLGNPVGDYHAIRVP